jgi:hypothetical protein
MAVRGNGDSGCQRTFAQVLKMGSWSFFGFKIPSIPFKKGGKEKSPFSKGALRGILQTGSNRKKSVFTKFQILTDTL